MEIDLAPESFQVFDHGQQRWVLEAGGVELRIGVSSRDIRLRKMLNIASVDVPSELATQLTGPEFLPADVNPGIAVSDELFGQMLNRPVPLLAKGFDPFIVTRPLVNLGSLGWVLSLGQDDRKVFGWHGLG